MLLGSTVLLLFFSQLPNSLMGGELIEVNTGRPNSASWMFTQELSAVWGMKYQDKESRFSPQYVESLYQRFVNLDKKDCRFVIAPLKSITELPISDLKVKIALILWQSYLAPITIDSDSTDIGFNTHEVWYLPEHGKMIPGFLERLEARYHDLSTDLSPELMEFARSVIWDKSDGFSYFEAELPSEDRSGDGFEWNDEPLIVQDSDDLSTDIGEEELQRFLTIKSIPYKTLEETFQLNKEEVLLYDMVGTSAPLLSSFDEKVRITSLTPELINRLLMDNTLLESFRFSRGDVNTVGMTFALFVHEDEDTEFVKEVIEAINNPPKSNLSERFMFSNLKTKETKEISPLFLHSSTIEFFGID